MNVIQMLERKRQEKVTVHLYSKVSAERNPSQRPPGPQSSHSKRLHAHIYPLKIVFVRESVETAWRLK